MVRIQNLAYNYTPIRFIMIENWIKEQNAKLVDIALKQDWSPYVEVMLDDGRIATFNTGNIRVPSATD